MPIKIFTALLVQDVQNDFMKDGALPVAGAEAVLEPISKMAATFDRVIATQEFRPDNHVVFADSHAGMKPGEHIDCDGQILQGIFQQPGTVKRHKIRFREIMKREDVVKVTVGREADISRFGGGDSGVFTMVNVGKPVLKSRLIVNLQIKCGFIDRPVKLPE